MKVARARTRCVAGRRRVENTGDGSQPDERESEDEELEEEHEEKGLQLHGFVAEAQAQKKGSVGVDGDRKASGRRGNVEVEDGGRQKRGASGVGIEAEVECIWASVGAFTSPSHLKGQSARYTSRDISPHHYTVSFKIEERVGIPQPRQAVPIENAKGDTRFGAGVSFNVRNIGSGCVMCGQYVCGVIARC
jgi:hypothetical protein